MCEVQRSLAGATDTGTTISNAAAGTTLVSKPCRVHRIRFYNIVANPISVLIYDNDANHASRNFCGKYDIPLVNDADLVEFGRDVVFKPPLDINVKLVCKASEANACYAIAFEKYDLPMTSLTL